MFPVMLALSINGRLTMFDRNRLQLLSVSGGPESGQLVGKYEDDSLDLDELREADHLWPLKDLIPTKGGVFLIYEDVKAKACKVLRETSAPFGTTIDKVSDNILAQGKTTNLD